MISACLNVGEAGFGMMKVYFHIIINHFRGKEKKKEVKIIKSNR